MPHSGERVELNFTFATPFFATAMRELDIDLKLCNTLHMILSVWTDGGCRNNPGAGACGWVLKDEHGKMLAVHGRFLEHTTNNQAEYQALIDIAISLSGLLHDAVLVPSHINFYTDSKLMVEHIYKRWNCENEVLKEMLIEVRKWLSTVSKYAPISLKHIPREENTEADAVCNRIMDEHGIVSRNKKVVTAIAS